MNRYQTAIEELALDGTIGLGQCSKSTVYRWAKKINQILETQKYDWRVKPDYKNRSLSQI